MTCTIKSYKGETFQNQEEVEHRLESDMLKEASQYSLYDNVPDHRDFHLAQAFHLDTLGAGEYAANIRQVNALKEWMKKDNVDVKMSVRNYTGTTGKFIVNFILPKLTQSKLYQAALPHENTEAYITTVLNNFQQVFPGLKFNFIDEKELRQENHVPDIKNIRAFVRNGEITLVRGRVTANTAIEEILHPFVSSLYYENRELFDNMMREGKALDPAFFTQVKNQYGSQTSYNQVDINKEFVTQMMQRALHGELKETGFQGRSHDSFLEMINKFFRWMADVMKDLVHHIDPEGRSVIDIEQLPASMKMSDIAMMLNTHGVTFSLNMITNKIEYNLSNSDVSSDELFATRGTIFKRDRAEVDITKIDAEIKQIHNAFETKRIGKNVEQLATLEILKKGSQEQFKFHDDNAKLEAAGQTPQKSISVTALIGSSQFSSVKDFSMFKDFGIAVHAIVESVQDLANKTGDRYSDIITREYFDNFMKQYQIENPSTKAFSITGLDADKYFELLQKFLSVIGSDMSNDFIVIPEYTIGTRQTNKDLSNMDDRGRMIIGRLDLMVIDGHGKIHIIDVKTKKIKSEISTLVNGKKTYYAKNINAELSREGTTINSTEGTLQEFHMNTRSVFDTWNLQLLAYEHLLAANGLSVASKKILALLYRADIEADTVFQDYGVTTFDGNFYSKNDAYLNTTNGQRSNAYETAGEEKDKQYRAVFEKYMPLTDKAKEKIKQDAERYAFDMNKDNYDEFIGLLSQAVKKDLEGISRQISTRKNEGATPEELQMLETRKLTLESYDKLVNTPEGDMTTAVKLSLVLESMDKEMGVLTNLWKTVYQVKENSPTRDKQTLVFQEVMVNATTLIDFMKEQMAEAIKPDSGSTVTKDSYVYKKVDDLNNELLNMMSDYRKFAVQATIRIVREAFPSTHLTADGTVIKGGIQKTMDDMSGSLNLQIAALERDIKNEMEGKTVGAMNKLKLKGMKIFDREGYKAVLEQATKILGPSEAKRLSDSILFKEVKIAKLKARRDSRIDESDKSLEEYILGVTNPNSVLYMGAEQGTQLVEMLGLNLKGFVASAGSSELAISAMVGFLKSSQFKADTNFTNDMQDSDLETLLRKFLQGRTTEQANEVMTEVRTVTYTDDKGVQTKVNYNSFVKPSSPEFDARFESYKTELRTIRDSINEVKAEYYQAIHDGDIAQAAAMKQGIVDKNKIKHAFVTKHIQWLREHASLPFIDAYYKNMEMIPDNVRAELEGLYLQREGILHSLGEDNDELMDEDDLDALSEIRVDIQRLRKTAAEQNADYATYMDNLEKLYVSVEKTSAFERAKSRKEMEHVNNPEELQKWMDRNTVTKATQAYHDEVNRIFTALSEIYGNSERHQELMDEKRSILKSYKTEDGSIDPRYILDSEIDRLDTINAELVKLRTEENAVRGKLSGDENKKAGSLRAELLRLQSRVLNKIYVQEMGEKYTSLTNALKDFKDHSAKLKALQIRDKVNPVDPKAMEIEDLAFITAERNFQTEQNMFEVWYNRHHTTKYVSILTKQMNWGTARNYLYDTVPARAEHKETVPNYKWYTREFSQEAHNPDYKEFADGTPMPKNLTINAKGHVETLPGHEDDKDENGNYLINRRYLQIQREESAKNFYNSMIKTYLDRQQVIHGKKNGYKVPGIMGSMVENFMEGGFREGMKKELGKFKDTYLRVQSQYDQASNLYGDMGSSHIRLRNNEQYGEDIQGGDSVGAAFHWIYESYVNEAMAEAQPVTKHMINLVNQMMTELQSKVNEGPEQAKRLKELKDVQDVLKFEYSKFISGQSELKENRMLKKAMGTLFKLASVGRLGFDLTSQTKNFVSGNVQAYLATSSSSMYSGANYRFAKKQLYGAGGFIQKYIADWGKVGNLSKETALFRIFNPMQSDYHKNLNSVTNSRTRRALEKMTNASELMFLLQEKGDTEIGMTVWLAIMDANHYRVMDKDETGGYTKPQLDEKGNQVYVNALDAYEMGKDNRLLIRKDVEYSRNDETSIQRKVYSEMRRAQGNFAKQDGTMQERGMVVKMMYFFRKYLIPMMVNRFGSLRPNWEGEEAAMGYWRAMFDIGKFYSKKQMALNLLLGGFGKSAKKFNEGVDPMYQRKAAQASKDFYANILFVSLSYLLLGMVKQRKKDEQPMSVMEGNLTRLIWGVQQETTSLTPIPGIGSFDDYIKNFSNMSSLVTDVTKLYHASEHAVGMGLVMAYDWQEPDADINPTANFLYNREVYQKKVNSFEAGTPKFYKDMYDITGFKNIDGFFHPSYKLTVASKNI